MHVKMPDANLFYQGKLEGRFRNECLWNYFLLDVDTDTAGEVDLLVLVREGLGRNYFSDTKFLGGVWSSGFGF